jgi:hypothetical protein
MAIQSLANCIDFLSEKTCLMYLGDLTNQLNIEYTWGQARGLYRKARLSNIKGKENF